eukprot:536055-Rhodomonas_salina.4
MPGTDFGYVATRPILCACHAWPIFVPWLCIAARYVSLRACYAVSGTDLAYDDPRDLPTMVVRKGDEVASRLCVLRVQCSTLSEVLYRTKSYDHPTQCPVIGSVIDPPMALFYCNANARILVPPTHELHHVRY